MRAWDRGVSSRNPLDLDGERSDRAVPARYAAFPRRAVPAGGVRESDTLANPQPPPK